VRYDVGQVVDGRYEVVAPLGSGGMSEAYKARDREGGGTVVVKIPYANLIGDPATFSRYQREMEIGKRLQHPNIQHLLAEGRLAGGQAPYMVLEYVDGELLRDYLTRQAPLPIDQAVAITLQLVDALDYCHVQGIVHRDLKPENALITPDGQVKLVDFGIALLRGARRLTYRHLSNSVGTPDYMAPEQVRGERGDERTDIYAVGVMLYEMLAGELPYEGDNSLAVMSQRVTADPPLLRRARPDAPPGLEAIVFRALRRDPAERYPSMAALRHDLEHRDEIAVPDYVEMALPRRPIGGYGMPSVLLVGGVIVALFAVLAAVGVLAELFHRSQIAP
jgi:eukaryotic-like serine/threonine-protein kinase